MNTPVAFVEPIDASDATSPMPYSPQPPLVASDAVNDDRWRNGLSTLRGAVARTQHWIRSLGPYVAIELLLPGGTIIALALWAYRQWRATPAQTIASSTDVAPAKPRAPLRCVTPCMQR
jgi:hypothetical protein